MKNMIKDALILCAITVISGLLLGFIYEVTKEPREKQTILKQNEAYKAVMKEASEFKEIDADEKKLYDAVKEISQITDKEVEADKCLVAFNKKGEMTGFVIAVTSKEGYAGNISFSVGIDMSGNVTGVSVTSIGETAGLGMLAKEESFLKQYKVTLESDKYEPYAVNGEGDLGIDAISGATITTNAMTKGVNFAKACAFYLKSDENLYKGALEEETESEAESESVSETSSEDTADEGENKETTVVETTTQEGGEAGE